MHEKLKNFAISKASAIGGFFNHTGFSIAKHVSTKYKALRCKYPPLVSPALLYKIGLGAVWSDGVLEKDEIEQIDEWLRTQPTDIATCLKEMNPPHQPIKASEIFTFTEPPIQIAGKVLLLKFVKQLIERKKGLSTPSEEFIAGIEQWIGLEPDQLSSIYQQLDAEKDLENEESKNLSLVNLWHTTSTFAIDSGAYVLDQSTRFTRYIGERATKSWKAFEDVPKPLKVALVTAAAGGTVVASPFLIASLSSTSIISILATLGFGAINVGGLGVAGGVGALIFSCASVSTITAYIGSGLIKDPEVEKLIVALRDLHALIEKSKQISTNHLDRLKKFDAAVKKLMLEKTAFTNEVILLRGKIEAMQEELQGMRAASK